LGGGKTTATAKTNYNGKSNDNSKGKEERRAFGRAVAPSARHLLAGMEAPPFRVEGLGVVRRGFWWNPDFHPSEQPHFEVVAVVELVFVVARCWGIRVEVSTWQ
jgi:hypothetical protein